MNFTGKEKKAILEGFLKMFARMSDREYQERVWVRGEGPECDSFIDLCCDFFDPADSIIENYMKFNITDKQRRLLIDFYKEFRAFSDEYDFAYEFIDTPEWAKIIEMAKEVLKAFNYSEKS